MAVKLPIFSKENKNELTEENGMSSVTSNEVSPAAGAAAAQPKLAAVGDTVTRGKASNPNATLLGDALQKRGDIRLPLIGDLP